MSPSFCCKSRGQSADGNCGCSIDMQEASRPIISRSRMRRRIGSLKTSAIVASESIVFIRVVYHFLLDISKKIVYTHTNISNFFETWRSREQQDARSLPLLIDARGSRKATLSCLLTSKDRIGSYLLLLMYRLH